MTLVGTNSRLEIAQDAGPQDWLITARVRQMKWRRTKRLLDALLTAAKGFVLNPGGQATRTRRAGVGQMQGSAKKIFQVSANWDPEAGVWWCSNGELPITTEAPTFDQLVARVMEIAPEIAELNGIAPRGEEIEIHVIGERVQSIAVSAAA